MGRLAARETGALNGTLSGPVQLDGRFTPSGLADVSASAMLNLVPGDGGVPVRGSLAINYDQRAGKLQFGDSQVDVGSSHAAISGTAGENLAVQVVSRNLNDAIPVLRALGAQPPAQWPVELQGGVARIDASIRGGLEDPKISGKADVEKLKLEGQQLDRVTSTFTLDRSSAVFQAITVEAGKMRVEGNGRAGLRELAVGRRQSRIGHGVLAHRRHSDSGHRSRLEGDARHWFGFRRRSCFRLARVAIGGGRGNVRKSYRL